MSLLKDIKPIIYNRALHFYSKIIVILSIIGSFTVIFLFFVLSQKIVKIFTPEFPLYVFPIELCDLTIKGNKVSCGIHPCHKDNEESCIKDYDKKKWYKENNKVITLNSMNTVPIFKFCEKNTDIVTCNFMEGEYKFKKTEFFLKPKNREDNKKNQDSLKKFFRDHCEKTNNPWSCIAPIYLESEK